MNEKIYFNGRVYNSRSEMPSEVRDTYDRFNKFFEDNDQDGIPDILQGGKGIQGLKDAFGVIKEISKTSQHDRKVTQDQFTVIKKAGEKITINGKTFNNLEELPPVFRQAYDRVMAKTVGPQENIFDESWRETKREEYFKPHDDEILNPQSSYDSPIEEVSSNTTLFILAIAGFVVICVALAGWLFISGNLPGF